MQNYDLIIKNSKAYINGKFTEKDIGITSGVIEKIGNLKNQEAQKIIDASGKLIIPGVIDSHVHLRDLGQSHKETFKTGCDAAAHGGVTTMLNMPNTIPPAITLDIIKRMDKLRENLPVDIRLFSGVRDNFQQIQNINNEKNVIGYKIYLDGGPLLLSREEFKNALEFFSNFFESKDAKVITIHAEDSTLIEKLGRDDTRCEIDAVRSVTGMVDSINYKFPVHIAHISTGEGVEIIKNSNQKNITTEVSPHHLFLSPGDVDGEFSYVNPPLREKAVRMKLWRNLNFIDIIATDHAPHTIEEKESGAAGFAGLETSLPLMLTAANKKIITIERMVAMMCEKPAQIFGLNDRGRIGKGMRADLTIIDRKHEWKIRGDDLYSKCKFTPFEGWKVKGCVDYTISEGNVIYERLE